MYDMCLSRLPDHALQRLICACASFAEAQISSTCWLATRREAWLDAGDTVKTCRNLQAKGAASDAIKFRRQLLKSIRDEQATRHRLGGLVLAR